MAPPSVSLVAWLLWLFSPALAVTPRTHRAPTTHTRNAVALHMTARTHLPDDHHHHHHLPDDDCQRKKNPLPNGDPLPLSKTNITSIDGQPLNHRFQISLNAITGQFSPHDAEADNERSTALADALKNFPCDCPLKVVSMARTDHDLDLFQPTVLAICQQHGVETRDVFLVPRLGGKCLSLSFTAVAVESSAALIELSDALQRLDIVRFVV